MSTDTKTKFEKKFREYLSRNGKSQKELADHLHCARSTVHKWIQGENQISAEDLVRVCDYLEIKESEQREFFSLAGYEELARRLASSAKEQIRGQPANHQIQGAQAGIASASDHSVTDQVPQSLENKPIEHQLVQAEPTPGLDATTVTKTPKSGDMDTPIVAAPVADIARQLAFAIERIIRQRWLVAITFVLLVTVLGIILVKKSGQISVENKTLPTSTSELPTTPNPSAAALSNISKPTSISEPQTTPITATVTLVKGSDISSTFDQDDDGWTIEGDGQRQYQDGYLCGTDTKGGEGNEWFWKAPQKLLGNQSDKYGGTLSFSRLLWNGPAGEIERKDDVVLIGADITLRLDTDNPGSEWTPYTVTLHESGGWVKEGDIPPTKAEMQKVLSSVSKLNIRGEYRNGNDISCLDNVTLHRP